MILSKSARMRCRTASLLGAALAFCPLAGARADPATDFTLRNGLRVVVRERHSTPLVAVELWVRAGAREEAVGEFGAAHFLEHTLFKGTMTRGVGEADAAIENLGASLNAATAPDYARFYTTVASAHTAEALAVLADVIRNATLPEAEVERERKVIRDELAQRDSDPEALLIDRLYERAFRDHAYGRPPGGTQPAIRDRTRTTLATFYRRTYSPERCTLVLVGDLTPDAAREIADRAFADWTARGPGAGAATGLVPAAAAQSAAPTSSTPSTPGPELLAAVPPEARRMVVTAEVARPMTGFAFRAPAAADAQEACAAQVVAAILGQSDIGGRLAVARLSGCQARVGYVPRRDASLFIVSSTVPLVSMVRARTRADVALLAAQEQQAAAAVLDSLLADPPSAAEVLAAKNALLGRMIFDTETDSGLAAALGCAVATGGQLPEAWREAITRVTVADVRQFIAKKLDPSRRMCLVLLPAAESQGARR
jgi:zinc protease